MDLIVDNITLMHGDCLGRLKGLPDNSVDLVLCDPPYGTTACKWDSIIPLDAMWLLLRQIIKPNGAIVLTASQPFTTVLVGSNLEDFKYDLVWHKTNPKGHLNAKFMPLRAHEDVLVFVQTGKPTYNPQKSTGHYRKVAKNRYNKAGDGSQAYGAENRDTIYDSTERYPTSVSTFSNGKQVGKVHPAQKPVELMEYLALTYSNEGDTILDFTMGSGTTGVAAVNTGRKFIGIELDPTYYGIACGRILDAANNQSEGM